MAGGRIIRNAIELGFAPGYQPWSAEMELTLRNLSVLCQAAAIGIQNETGGPVQGDIVVLPSTHGTHPNKLAYYDNATWFYFAPFDGMRVFVNDFKSFIVWNAAQSRWEAGLKVAPTIVASQALTAAHCNAAVPVGAAGAVVVTVPLDATLNFPIGTTVVLKRIGAGSVTIAPEGAVNLRSSGGLLVLTDQYSEAGLWKMAANEWAVSGKLS